MRSLWFLTGLAGVMTVAASVGACSASGGSGSEGFGGDGRSSNGALGTGGSSGALTLTSTGTGVSPADCHSGPNDDADGDGWTVAQGDCNDCDANVNPGAIEVSGMGTAADENCDGNVDNVNMPCDAGLALDDTNPMSAAKAIGLCQVASADGTKGKAGYAWGVVSATYARASGQGYGTPGAQVGLLTAFGSAVHPQEGSTMLALSSGRARTPGQPGACNSISCVANKNQNTSTNPANFPSMVPGCPGGPNTVINDDIALLVKLRAPTNAKGYKFKFKFNSFEFPYFVCSKYNDQFIALVSPAPMGSINGNISFDSMHNPVSVNIGFFDFCNAQSQSDFAGDCNGCKSPPSPYCPKGNGDLAGTGFDTLEAPDAGATSWLESQAPIGGGEEFTLQFTIWDAGDQRLDSTVLIDGFEWIASNGTVAVGTGKVPMPK